MTLQIVFAHGKESGPWGTKIRAMSSCATDAGHRVHSIDYRGIDEPIARVERLLDWVSTRDGRDPLVLVGSSYGGYVSAVAAPRVAPVGLFLLAPAFYLPDVEPPDPAAIRCPVEIVHGHRDEVVPVADSLRFAGAGGMTLHAIDGDHRLIEALPAVLELFALALARFDQ